MVFDVDPEYIAARRALLDALDALEGHRRSLVLIGAQAVYVHTGAGDLGVAPMTTDADLAIDTRTLADEPEITGALRAAGFTSGANPGHWIAASQVAVDLMIAPHQSGRSGTTARSPRIPPHEKHVARIASGLEPSLVDNEVVTLTALDPDDDRSTALRVAGPVALLVAKAIKLSERLDSAERRPDRVKEKDALDVYRLLQAVDVSTIAEGFKRHRSDEFAAPVSDAALSIYREYASDPRARIVQLAVAAAQSDPTVAPSFASLVTDMLRAA